MLNNKKPGLDKRLKPKFSAVDKQKLYSEWKVSGLSKSEFCKKEGLVFSIFLRWCQEFSCHEPGSGLSLKKSQVFSVSKNTTKKLETPMLIEIKLPNGMTFSTSFKLTCFLSLLKDLNYALN